jgi:hypothetical protein
MTSRNIARLASPNANVKYNELQGKHLRVTGSYGSEKAFSLKAAQKVALHLVGRRSLQVFQFARGSTIDTGQR